MEGTIAAGELEIDALATVKQNILPEEKEEELIYDAVINTVISPVKVLINESTWF